MYKLFISYSSADSARVKRFIDFLCMGVNVSKEDIFSATLDDNLPTGTAFADRIREALLECDKIICLISENYLMSHFCMAELGAAWIQDNKLIPMLLNPVNFEKMKRTPIAKCQMRFADSEEGLCALRDELCACGIGRYGSTNDFNERVRDFLGTVKKKSTDGRLIECDKEGFFTAEIAAVRNVPQEYRCYKIRGLLKLDEPPKFNETHWIFFRRGMYDEPRIGDKVYFKVGQTELRQFYDVDNARNIYPDALMVLRHC